MPTSSSITIAETEVKLSNLNKIFYPQSGFTKAEMIDYYLRIAPVLLPHLSGRPLTLKRYPNGANRPFFYQKECPKPKPDWIHTVPIWSEGNGRYTNYCVVDDLPALIWAANLAALELHTSLSLGKDVDCPTMAVFDLDPGPPATIVECTQVALWLRDVLQQNGLQSFPKTSGSKGLQIYVPINLPISYATTKLFAHSIARLLSKNHPEQVVSKMFKELRTGKVFIDWSQNDSRKTTVVVYSLRAKEEPQASTPVTWDEVAACSQQRNRGLLTFDVHQTLERVEKMGDLFAPVLQIQQMLPPAFLH